LEEFGDAAALAASFSALVRARRRRLIMRCTIGTSLVMAGLMIGVFAFRPTVENDSIVAQAQQASLKAADRVSDPNVPAPSDRRDDKTRNRLSNNVDAQFKDIPLQDALDYLGAQLEFQFYIDRKSIEAEGLAVDVPVNFGLKEVPGEMVLDLMLRELGLAYTIRSGVVVVASKSNIQSQTEVRVYPITNGADELAQLIPNTIEPHTWRYMSHYPAPHVESYAPPRTPNAVGGVGALEEGGAGSSRVFQGALVVSQTPDVHRKIETLINDLNSVLSRRAPATSAGTHPPAYLDPLGHAGPTTVIESAPPVQAPVDGSGPVVGVGPPSAEGGPGVTTKAYPAPSRGSDATTKELPQRK
jgi:hypothetical protein